MLRKARILIVDDVAIHLALLRAILEQKGHTVVPCTSGPEALEAVIEAAPDIMLVDIVMPDMDGFAFIEALRARRLAEGVPFVFITGDNDPVYRQKATDLGASDYLLKPIEPEHVLTSISKLLGANAPATPPPTQTATAKHEAASQVIPVGRRSALGVMEGSWRLTLPDEIFLAGPSATITASELMKRSTARISARATERGINVLLDPVPTLTIVTHVESLTRAITTMLEAAITRGEPGGTVRARLEATTTGLRARVTIPCAPQDATHIAQSGPSAITGARLEPGEGGGLVLIADLKPDSKAQ